MLMRKKSLLCIMKWNLPLVWIVHFVDSLGFFKCKIDLYWYLESSPSPNLYHAQSSGVCTKFWSWYCLMLWMAKHGIHLKCPNFHLFKVIYKSMPHKTNGKAFEKSHLWNSTLSYPGFPLFLGTLSVRILECF